MDPLGLHRSYNQEPSELRLLCQALACAGPLAFGFRVWRCGQLKEGFGVLTGS